MKEKEIQNKIRQILDYLSNKIANIKRETSQQKLSNI